MICSPNNFDYEGTGQVDGCVRVTALANPAYWFRTPEEEYASAKQTWCERMAAAAVRHIPHFRPYVVDTDVFSPRTITRFTGHLQGAVYGAADKVLSGETGIRGLHLCGTDQGFLGIIGSMLSGITMANNHLLRD